MVLDMPPSVLRLTRILVTEPRTANAPLTCSKVCRATVSSESTGLMMLSSRPDDTHTSAPLSRRSSSILDCVAIALSVASSTSLSIFSAAGIPSG